MKHWIIAGAALALVAATGGASVAQPMGGQPERRGGAVRAACQADIQKLCSDIEPGGHGAFRCLREHQDQLSDGCKSAMANALAYRQAHQGGSPQGSPSSAPPPN